MYVATIGCMHAHAVSATVNSRSKSNDIINEGGSVSILQAKPRVPLSNAQVAVIDSSSACAR